jgi:predicted transcriptional regulator
LIEKIEEGKKTKKNKIVLTDKGYEFLANYNKIREFTEAFGL